MGATGRGRCGGYGGCLTTRPFSIAENNRVAVHAVHGPAVALGGDLDRAHRLCGHVCGTTPARTRRDRVRRIHVLYSGLDARRDATGFERRAGSQTVLVRRPRNRRRRHPGGVACLCNRVRRSRPVADSPYGRRARRYSRSLRSRSDGAVPSTACCGAPPRSRLPDRLRGSNRSPGRGFPFTSRTATRWFSRACGSFSGPLLRPSGPIADRRLRR